MFAKRIILSIGNISDGTLCSIWILWAASFWVALSIASTNHNIFHLVVYGHLLIMFLFLGTYIFACIYERFNLKKTGINYIRLRVSADQGFTWKSILVDADEKDPAKSTLNIGDWIATNTGVYKVKVYEGKILIERKFKRGDSKC
ncbi:hypothetical protein [Paenibacillus sp. Leaf72]|uniref:hypothetical protein n=1 Tax=Paenibacillus sp. Leaf72 TaxID=1736234 RepID=UPI0006F8D9F6|nr:hypothetical protein [Paenibacillus sp. Leaf72]KQN96967.1 hypothetical protein ASF12_23145 [Paenibacillus sp. Leaf72]